MLNWIISDEYGTKVETFKNYVEDPSNKNVEFKRVKIRNFIKDLELEGLDKDKFNLTIKNLRFANETIKYFVEKNLKDNSTISNSTHVSAKSKISDDSKIFNSTIINSVIINSTIRNSTIKNQRITKDSISNSTISNSILIH